MSHVLNHPDVRSGSRDRTALLLADERGFSFSQNYPNPFNPMTVIRFTVPEGNITRVSLQIYDLHGRQVRKLEDEVQSPGVHSVVWKGKDERGIDVASGIYLFQIKAGEYSSAKKMTVLR